MKIDRDKLIAQFARAKFYVGEESGDRIFFESDQYDYQIEAYWEEKEAGIVKFARTFYPDNEPFISRLEVPIAQILDSRLNIITDTCKNLMNLS